MRTLTEVIGVVIAAFVMIFVLGLIFSLPVMWLWNGCLVGAIDGVREIGWLQSFGILILSGLLFKSTASKKD